jgi:membrane-bound metal-dependent hydrolase YbcI (DUF457 family)
MNWKAHVLVGVIVCFVILLFFETFQKNMFLLLLEPLYSLISDIDHKNSKITWIFLSAALVLLLCGIFNQLFVFFGIGLLALTLISVFFFHHRGFTHSISFGLLISLPFLFFGALETIIVFSVFYSHLILDGIFLQWW